ncbi:hypothetical protein Glove_97g81 [Diversispora epigaea]|uniref:Protein kinase domain-containing protein n=1 Tax=Diversispora epigaea TaxID=1348612 RepID=A0A397J4P8_9GLOM|nr:hypothetical protein Glove_97g81 [Diversispora epigaea]
MPYVCPECNQKYNQYHQWCKPCNSTHFKNDFDKWTSGNDTIDKFIQDAQLNADRKVIEWIPYDRFQDIKQIAKGSYGTIYYAKWIDGRIEDWDIANQQWSRKNQFEVGLKKLDGIVDTNEDFLNEMAIHLRANDGTTSVRFYGISRDPGTHEYVMVLEYCKGGSLRNYLNNNFNNIDWGSKLEYLYNLANNFSKFHQLNIIHCGFHPSNILSSNFDYRVIKISDFGSSKLITENIKNPNPQKNTISGVLPYIAPEVLSGEEYTKVADVYSFAFVAYELISGITPFHDVPHNKDLAFKICNGFRPEIPFHTPKLITKIIMRCWDARITHRPTFKELRGELFKYRYDYWAKDNKNNNKITIQIKEAEIIAGDEKMPRVCSECNQEFDKRWCKPCNSTHFKNDFDKWTSGNEKMDKFIQDAQLNADDFIKIIEWIPYDRFRDIKQINKGGYGTIHYAKWIDGYIRVWITENQQWKRKGQCEVALKKFDGFIDLNEDFLNEMAIRLKTSSSSFYGITKDPETHKYMMVLEYFEGGSLRNYLNNNFNNIDWESKLYYLKNLANELLEIHKLGIVHRDFHPGNILKDSYSEMHISDPGLSLSITEKNIAAGILPYMAPEVLRGEGEYTKAADVYSFAFVAYELITGIPPYHDVPHDEDLALKICNGLRPEIPIHLPKLITEIIMRCWDYRITHRPTSEQLYELLKKYLEYYRENDNKNNNEITIQIKEAEEFSKNQTTDTITSMNYKTHPQAIFTSRLLGFSNLPKPKNEENFEKKLEELTESFYQINATIFTSRLLGFSNLPKPKNEENFEKKLEELTESFYQINATFYPQESNDEYDLEKFKKCGIIHVQGYFLVTEADVENNTIKILKINRNFKNYVHS